MKQVEYPIEMILYQKDPDSELKIIYVFEKDFETSDAYEDFKNSLEQRCYCVAYYPYSSMYKCA